MGEAEEDEWEYEYDENETEDFYITLDLSDIPDGSDVPSANRLRSSAVGNPMLLQSRLRAFNANQRNNTAAVELTAEQYSETYGKIQVMGLHTPNPLIMYNTQLLSCKWAATIGTDMFFVKPNPDSDAPDSPLRSLPEVDLLALGSVKLMAKAALLEPRKELYVRTNAGEPNIDAMDTSGERPQDGVETAQPAGTESRSAPTGFLARLNEAKAKRGDKSRLVVTKGANGTRLVSERAPPPPADGGDNSNAAMPGPATDVEMEDADERL